MLLDFFNQFLLLLKAISETPWYDDDGLEVSLLLVVGCSTYLR
jgi:hypothetical protein